jgi:hypothetical protein
MIKLIFTGLAAAAISCAVTPSAATASVGSSCPPGNSGYMLWDVTTEPYAADNAVDEQGNNDGLVCALPMKVVIDEDGNPFQLYNFIDNRVAAP